MSKESSLFQWEHPHLVDPKSTSYKWLVLIVVTMLLVLTMFAIISVSLSDSLLRGVFALGSSEHSWVNTSMLLAMVVAVPLSEYLAETKGFKLILFVGTTLFILGLTMSALAWGFVPLLISRIIAGVGSGLFVPISIAVISFSFQPKEMPFALAIYAAGGFGGGLSVAFHIGGYLAQHAHWQWIFLPSVIFGIPCLMVIWLVLQETEKKVRGKFDWLGFISYSLWLISLLVILVSAKAAWNTEGWYSNFMKSFYATFAFFFLLFLVAELHCECPLFNLRLFKNRPFVLGCVLVCFIGANYFATAQMFPSVLQELLRYSKFDSGLYMVPFGAVLGLSSAGLGLVMSRVGIRIPLLIGCTLLAATCYMQFYFSIYSDHIFITTLFVLRGFGVGLSMGPATALAMRRVEPEQAANASMIVTLFRQVGAALATSALTTIEIMRATFHKVRFGEQLGHRTVEYEETIDLLKQSIQSDYGVPPALAEHYARGEVSNVVERQATLAGFNDGYILLGTCIFIATAVVAACMLYVKVTGGKINIHED